MKPRSGWQSVFSGKDRSCRFQGITTKRGAKAFEGKRRRLATLAKIPVAKVSDGDVIEYLAVGEEETLKVLAQ